MRISHSLIRCYKSCRRLYYLQYVEGLKYNKAIEPLEIGKSYHRKIEDIYKQGYFELDYDNPKVSAMAMAYERYIYPQFAVKNVEEWFEIPLGNHVLVGRKDGIAEDGLPVEHKTTSTDIDEAYIYGLQWDEQILTYMLASGEREMYYTVIRKPTIRLKKGETNEEYFDRCCEWYSEDTDSKIRVIKVTRADAEVEKHRNSLIAIADEIESCTEFYNNPTYCTSFGRRCEYCPICLDYDPHFEYVDFTRKEEKHFHPEPEVELF